jgi:hypothetical protein
MSDTVLLGQGDQISEIPRVVWEGHLSQVPEHSEARLSFMSEDHHLVRRFVVTEMPRAGMPLEPDFIAVSLKLPVERVNAVLDDLERNLFFLVRNSQGAVTWAYPVTVEQTPHELTFSTGERLYGAWAEDAIATPFVQGRLREQHLSVGIRTECAHCGRRIQIDMDSELKYRVHEEQAKPLVFEPHIEWATFQEPNIIHAYWRNSVFFWSEEHAREYRTENAQINGLYLTLEQSAFSTPIVQGALFALK